MYQDIAYPVTKEFREKLYGVIMSAYEQSKTAQQDKTSQRDEDTKSAPEEYLAPYEEELPFR